MQEKTQWISYQQPRTQELKIPALADSNVKLLVRREDENHPLVSGNKWWKLKYNLLEAVNKNYDTVLTFGGAYSNHIYATAAGCKELGKKSIGVIRGEEVKPLNPTLSYAEKCEMKFHFVTRCDYRSKTEQAFVASLEEKYGRCFIIPEGGTNTLAVQGCEELGKLLLESTFDYVCLPVGTGGTIAGIIKAFAGSRKIIGIPVLKDGGFLKYEIEKLVPGHFNNWQLMSNYHHQGYAKTNSELEKFIVEMKLFAIPTEHVYSAKLFWAVTDLVKKRFFEPGSTILILHTGGLQNVTPAK